MMRHMLLAHDMHVRVVVTAFMPSIDTPLLPI